MFLTFRNIGNTTIIMNPLDVYGDRILFIFSIRWKKSDLDSWFVAKLKA